MNEAVERRMRVVYVDHVARLSGGEIALLRILPALAEHVDVHVILGEDGPLRERLDAAGIDVEVIPLPPRLRDLRKSTIRWRTLDLRAVALLPVYILRLSRRLRELEADVVHANSLKAGFYAGVAARLAGVPAVWHVRDRIADDYLPRGAVRLVWLAVRLLPVVVVANSQATLETLPVGRRREVVYNPVVPDAVEPRADSARRPGANLVIGVLGRLAPWKGQHVFLAAFAQAFRGTDVCGRVIGSALFGEDAYVDDLVRQAADLGIAEQIEFRGFCEDVWAELGELDVLVHCSVSPEPFGQVVLEGMAVGLAVVATDAGGPAELIASGVDGLLVPADDVDALAACLRDLSENPELRHRLGAAAQTRSREFTPARTAGQLVEIYSELLGYVGRIDAG
jgi:glycosyltransferase involved in cell wall biosynthesis